VAKPIKEEAAPQLPVYGKGNRIEAHERMPRLSVCIGADGAEPRGCAYFWNSDNKHGGNHEGMVAMAAKDKWSLETKQIKLYGYTEKTVSATYPKFSPDMRSWAYAGDIRGCWRKTSTSTPTARH